jgi:hypothetical protein
VAKLVAKYGGLAFWDEDTEQVLHTDSEELDWRKSRGKNKSGYVIACYPEDYDKDEKDSHKRIEWWEFVPDLRESICDYYKKNPKAGVQVLEERTGNDDDEEETNESEQQFH